ncbi:hypothetical protein HJC23_008244 [Cyclotella cryptica]|uniref:RING-type domain-containing protein n=1 Tax=Cyclotella cryptica TaxID=29204 RepID=A0ABD3Q6V6_9STRA|eukprot:CCRYP_008387-RA/>CCRYP_008387-RA protein AED:0.20 eAED:0.20 QI:0/-1/0/1/-1/1/1/0/311
MNETPSKRIHAIEQPLNTSFPMNARKDSVGDLSPKFLTTPTFGSMCNSNKNHIDRRDDDDADSPLQFSPIRGELLDTPLKHHVSEDDRDAADVHAASESDDEQCKIERRHECDSSFPQHNDDIEINQYEASITEETEEQRTLREIEESEALARQLMAEEAMASYDMSANFLRDNADQFSAEDLAALQAAMAEEDPEALNEEYDADESREMSYDALLRLGERIGDVKEERWALIAREKIDCIPTIVFDMSMAEGKDENHTEVKCLVCQFPYEDGDELRRLTCQHCFHKECIDSWLHTKDTCAFCRKSIVEEN